jgi:protein-S-isoprenylcysteine O-methyltransferase Ste14
VLEILARFRVALGFVFGVLVLWLAAPTRDSIAVGAAIAVAGEAIRLWAAGHLNKSREVTASGPYRWLAHPLYVGSSIMGVGLAVASGRAIVAAIIAVYLVATLTAAIRSEEAFLRGRFGDQYDQYRRHGQVDEDRRFSLAQALRNREHRAVVGLMVAVLMLVLKATYNDVFWRAAGH